SVHMMVPITSCNTATARSGRRSGRQWGLARRQLQQFSQAGVALPDHPHRLVRPAVVWVKVQGHLGEPVPQDLGPLRRRDRSVSTGTQLQLLYDGLPDGRAELLAVVQQPQQVGLRHLLQRHGAMFPKGHVHGPSPSAVSNSVEALSKGFSTLFKIPSCWRDTTNVNEGGHCRSVEGGSVSPM